MLFQKNKIGNSFEENETTIRKYDAAVRRCWIMIRCAQHDKTNDYRCNHTCFHFICCCFVAFPAIWERIAGISSPEKQKETENEMEWMKRVREREREREREWCSTTLLLPVGGSQCCLPLLLLIWFIFIWRHVLPRRNAVLISKLFESAINCLLHSL